MVFTPFGLAHPTWEDDPDFDLDNHIEERELPAPGDDRLLSRTGGEIFCELLDRRHPLWKATVLQGHESGGTVVFMKLHHSMVDGVSSIDLLEVLHASEPDAPAPSPPADRWLPVPTPHRRALLGSGVGDQLASAADGVRAAVGALRTPRQRLRQLEVIGRTAVSTLPLALRPRPRTPFNSPISASREFAWLELPFDEMTTVRKQLGATVNDIVLATLGAGLARYMRRHGYDTDGVTLRVLCPVSMRRSDQHGALGNLVSMVSVGVDAGTLDAVERLRGVRASMEQLKADDQAGGLYDVSAVVKALPAPLFALPWRHLPRTYWPHNITSTNVAGPRSPLYLGPHELLHWYPVGVQWTDNALFLCALSYREYLVLGLVADPNVVPDVWEANEDLRAAYEELSAAAGR